MKARQAASPTTAEGPSRRIAFIEELNGGLKDRLRRSGFSEAFAEETSDRRVRSSGGLM